MGSSNAMFNISYGLYILTAKSGEKDNGCIINTVMQVTSSPNRISIAVNKSNCTHDMIKESGAFNVSVLTQDTPMSVFKHFGFQSGKDVDKFADFPKVRSMNGIVYVPDYANSYISAKVIDSVDLGTHTVFFAEVTQAKVLTDAPSVTYDYYHANIKTQAKPQTEVKKGYVCKICGYVYEGSELPPDFVCPICKHGAEDFEEIK